MADNISKIGLKFIASWEGFRDQSYLDAAGLPTIGFGHLIKKGEEKLFEKGISKTRALKLLKSDADQAVNAINDLVQVPLNQNQFDALSSFIFNVGSGAFQKSTLLKKLNQGQYSQVAVELLRWVYAGGKRVKGLVNRRKAERGLFLKAVSMENNNFKQALEFVSKWDEKATSNPQVFWNNHWLGSEAYGLEWPLCLAVFDASSHHGPSVADKLYLDVSRCGEGLDKADKALKICDLRLELLKDPSGKISKNKKSLKEQVARVEALVELVQEFKAVKLSGARSKRRDKNRADDYCESVN